MIEKGLLLEPVPMAIVIAIMASIAVQDWTSWAVVCISGVLTSAAIAIRRRMRMMALSRHLQRVGVEVSRQVQKWQETASEATDARSFHVEREEDPREDNHSQMSRKLGNSSSNRASTSSLKAPLRVLTYNLYLRPPLINSNGNDWKDERLDEFILSVLPHYDVIALQEVFALGSSRQSRLIHAAKHYGYGHIVKSVAPPFVTSLKFIDAGLLILSRYPIIDAAGHIFKTGHQIDHYAAKQVIYARIAVSESVQVNVFTTHTQASYYENSADKNAQNDSARLTQLQELCHFVKQKVFNVPGNEGNPVLILGDLNLDARSSATDGFTKGTEYHWLEDLFDKEFSSRPTQVLEHMKKEQIEPGNPDLVNHNGTETGSNNAPALEVHDLILERYNGEHPPTYGDALTDENGKVIRVQEPVLTNSADWGCRLAIDYIFLITNPNNPKLRVVPDSTCIQKFEVDYRKFPFFQLSDHYAVDTLLEIL
jgi:endonuclease/exonuclease/phosphatase family metal-dependent hydrolase